MIFVYFVSSDEANPRNKTTKLSLERFFIHRRRRHTEWNGKWHMKRITQEKLKALREMNMVMKKKQYSLRVLKQRKPSGKPSIGKIQGSRKVWLRSKQKIAFGISLREFGGIIVSTTNYRGMRKRLHALLLNFGEHISKIISDGCCFGYSNSGLQWNAAVFSDKTM